MPVIVTPVSGSGQPTALAGNQIVSEVARVVGGENESSVRAQALTCINRCRRELNQHDFRFTKTAVASTAFVAATQTYALPSIFKKPSFFLLLDINLKPYLDLAYLDDAAFTHMTPQRTLTGPPRIYTLRNDFIDGLISFYPVPDATTVSNYTWAGEYYNRMVVVTDDATPIASLPEEVTNVLIMGGQAYLLRERLKDSPVTPQAYADYQRTLNLLLVNDRRMNDEQARMRLPSRYGRKPYPGIASSWYGWFP